MTTQQIQDNAKQCARQRVSDLETAYADMSRAERDAHLRFITGRNVEGMERDDLITFLQGFIDHAKKYPALSNGNATLSIRSAQAIEQREASLSTTATDLSGFLSGIAAE